jgi:hypothetical protein
MGTCFAFTTGCYAVVRFDECPYVKFRTINFWQLLVCVDPCTRVTVLWSIDYFQRSDACAKPGAESTYCQLPQPRETCVPQDDTGLDGFTPTTQQTAWQRTC